MQVLDRAGDPLAYNRGVRGHDLREIERHIYKNHANAKKSIS
jgi:3-methyladenine DNA glycosylase AlkD